MNVHRRGLWLPLTIVLAVMAATLLPACGVLFSCGCALATGESHCNVHRAGVPHCPWCAGGGWVGGVNVAAIVAAVVIVTRVVHRRRKGRVWVSIGAGLGTYVVAALAAAMVTAWLMGYPLPLLARMGHGGGP